MWPFISARTGAVTNLGGAVRPRIGCGCHGPEVLIAMLGVVLIAGCAKTVANSQYESAKWDLEKPSQIYVYDFAVTRDHVHENAGLLQEAINDFHGTTTYQHQDEIMEEVRRVAAEELVKGIQDLGLPAQRVSSNTPLPKGALGITGQFLDVDEGNKAQRLIVGFGKGQSRVDVRIQLYENGLDLPSTESLAVPTRLLEFDTHADSGSMPGAIITGPAAAAAAGGLTVGVAAASVGVGVTKSYRSAMGAMTSRSAEQAVDFLSEYFGRQGWIRPGNVKQADRP